MYRSESLYEYARQMIKDEEVYPVFVPSYNRPDAKLLQHLLKEPEFPVILCIRREQADLYKDYVGKCRIMLLDNVHDIAETRRAIYMEAQPFYDNIFMMDDDIEELDFLIPSKTKNGIEAMRTSKVVRGELPRWIDILKMWMVMIGYEPTKRLAISTVAYRPDSWHMKNCNGDLYLYNSGACIQCIHLNLRLLKEHGIMYKPHAQVGNEDYALQFDAMSAGLLTCKFTDLEYGCPAICSTSGGCENANGFQDHKERYHWYVSCAKAYYGNHPGIKYSKTSRTGIESVKFNWKHWRNFI